jgi:L-lactate dehydrogenase complex protein LldF
MPNNFKTHIHNALSNPGLQTALDNNAERRQNARLLAYQSLPEDIQMLRQRARAVRARVIANLDQYLDQFCERASANGMIIHRAANASEAIQVVLEIAKQKDARLIAKSKSMLSEEIHLNPALEKQGIEVVETDLGEYIVQLRGEPPAHIITPAVHLRAADVGHTFEEKLNLPFTEDVPTMTAAARDKLRQVFMQADIGITGVNFGVAETGTISLVTNEGNGRMVMTLPPVHIALMGIERLVPTLDDLALMLYLLPRSATGQKLSVYVSLAHSPAPQSLIDGTPIEGPKERHIILVDNGRRAVSQSPLAEALYCIRCGTCLNVCPVFREIGGHAYVNIHGVSSTYPGPIGSVLSPAFFGQSEFGHLARASSLCGACKESCPVDIDLPKLLLRIRAGMTEQREGENSPHKATPNAPGYLAWGLRFFTWIAVSPGRFAAAQRMAGIFSRVVAPVEPWIHMPALTGWGYSKDFPRPAAKPFRDHWKERQNQSQVVDNLVSGKAAPLESQVDQSRNTEIIQESLVDRFCNELDALGGKSVLCSLADLSSLVLNVLEEEKITRIQAWKASELPVGLLDDLRDKGIEIQHQYDPAIRLGLTGVESAIAESGTLVMVGTPEQPLTASLVPEIHVAILPASKIQKSLTEALASSALRQATAATLISGPSRTADIEMTLTVGMHGPRQVLVFCLMDS